jgi:hypothetical protein
MALIFLMTDHKEAHLKFTAPHQSKAPDNPKKIKIKASPISIKVS